MRYVLQEAADRLGAEDVAIDEFPWHQLQPGHITALVSALRADGYAPNTSSLYVNAIRGVMNQAWQQSLITQDHLLKIRAVKAGGGSRLTKGRNLRRTLIRELMDLIEEARTIQEEIDSTFTYAYQCLQRANIENGISMRQ